jgi:hypothetical protein
MAAWLSTALVGQILLGGSDARIGVPGSRNDFGLRPGTGSDLRSKLSDLFADLWQVGQLHRVLLYIHGAV